jgi:hypothetical protein
MIVDVCVWEPPAYAYDTMPTDHPVVAYKAARVVEFQGKEMTMGEEASYEFDPKLKRTDELHKWFSLVDVSQLKSIKAEVCKEIDITRAS